jgi:Fe-S cluster biogenesis protein NfuA
MYAGIMGGACNGCHLSTTNDGVPSAELTLTNF